MSDRQIGRPQQIHFQVRRAKSTFPQDTAWCKRLHMGTRTSDNLRITQAAPVRIDNSYQSRLLAASAALRRSLATCSQSALVQEQVRVGTTRQCPVYYVFEVLTTSKCNMMELEKISYAVVMASRKLHHYFEAFKVRVTSDRGLGELFRNPEASVQIAKWAAELSGYHITFEPRTAIKSQVLTDFIVD
jgi:hypothetical protein